MNDIYYQKYLKYKAKYTDLKQQGGLFTLKNGVFAFFCSNDVANSICSSVHSSSPSNAKLNELLEKSGPAYRGKNGDLKLTIVKESYLKKAQKKAGELASTTGTKLLAAASATGAALGKAAVATGSILGKAAAAAGTSINKNADLLKTKVMGETTKVNINNLSKNSPVTPVQNGGTNEKAPSVIELNGPLQTNNESQLRETGNKLKAIDESINTVVVIEIKTFGSNICLNKFSL